MRLSLTHLRRAVVVTIGVLIALVFVAEIADAQRRGGGGRGGGRGGGGGGRAARANVNRDFSRRAAQPRPAVQRDVNRDVRRDVNRDVNRDINRNVDVDRDWNLDVDVDDDWYPVGRAAAAAVTAAAIGSIAYNLPASCVTQVVDGVTYKRCNGTWYEPQFSGSTVTYVVVSPP